MLHNHTIETIMTNNNTIANKHIYILIVPTHTKNRLLKYLQYVYLFIFFQNVSIINCIFYLVTFIHVFSTLKKKTITKYELIQQYDIWYCRFIIFRGCRTMNFEVHIQIFYRLVCSLWQNHEIKLLPKYNFSSIHKNW